MNRAHTIEHRFVQYIPDVLDAGILYVSIEYATAVHQCCCGCGQEVVTAFSPTDWRLVFDGETVSLDPSIGNWGFACRSHYWILRNRIYWARAWSAEEIAQGRRLDMKQKQAQYQGGPGKDDPEGNEFPPDPFSR